MVTTPVRPSPLADGAEAFMHYMIDVQSLKVNPFALHSYTLSPKPFASTPTPQTQTLSPGPKPETARWGATSCSTSRTRASQSRLF